MTKGSRTLSGRPVCVLVALASAVTYVPYVPAAESTLEEVIVTAQKREQDPQDVGVALQAFSGAQLQQAGVDDLKSLTVLTPAMQLGEYGGASTVNTISIRGVTQLDFAD